MHLKVSEALALLDRWRSEQVALEVISSSANVNRKDFGMVVGLEGTDVTLATRSGELKVDLTGADFNGDHMMPAQSRHAATWFASLRIMIGGLSTRFDLNSHR